MKCLNYIFVILVIFFKTGNVLSSESIFNVNNIEVKDDNANNHKQLANQAIKEAYSKLINRILLEKDREKLLQINFSEVSQLVSYYKVSSKKKDGNFIKIFNISFDKEKLHDQFYKLNISYSDILKKELYILPILKKKDKYFIYNQNIFYENWNKFSSEELIEFILPIENIEIIEKINLKNNYFFDLNLSEIFKEYSDKNLALILIEDSNKNDFKIFIRTKIMGKNISRNLLVKKTQTKIEFYKEVVTAVNKELINIIKSQNLVDIKTPSFLNTKLILGKKNNLVELNYRLKKIDLIENIYVQELNNNYVSLKIKYLGKLDKMIKQLKDQNITLALKKDVWNLNIK
tara:strand:- start:357 stop:1394 length:1038 start_codon:yes stop_codon:yes gene_type:complete